MPPIVPALGVRVQAGPPGTAVVHLDGELDLATAPQLVEAVDALLASRPPLQRLVVDLGGLAFVDVVGLDVLLRAQQRVAAGGGSVVVRRPSALVRRVVELLDLTPRLPLED